VGRTLRSPRLRRILIAYTINRLGSWLGLVALSLGVFDHTHDALAVAGLLLAWQALPAFVVPALVAHVETSKRRGGLSGLYLFEALVTAALALLIWHFNLAAVLALAALDGTAALAANALLRTEVARVARAEASIDADGAAAPGDAALAERNANAAVNVAFSVSFVTGPAIGGVVAAAAGVPAALLIDVATFVVCGILLLDLKAHVEETASDSVTARLRVAWEHIRSDRSLRTLLVVDTTAMVFVQAGSPIEVPLLKATLHGGDRGYGLFVTVWGAGAVASSLLFARSKSPALATTLSGAVCALGAAFVGLALAPTVALACFAAFVGGFGNGLYVPSIISLVQRLTPQALHGRLMGAVESLGAVAVALGLPLGGALVALSSPRTAFLALGIAALAAGAVYIWLALSAFEPRRRRAAQAPETTGRAHKTMALPGHQRPPE